MNEIADEGGEIGVRAGEGKFGGEMRGRWFWGKAATGQPRVQVEAGSSEAEVDPASCSATAHHVGDGADAQEFAFFHDGEEGADFLKVRENVRSDENCFASTMEAA